MVVCINEECFVKAIRVSLNNVCHICVKPYSDNGQ